MKIFGNPYCKVGIGDLAFEILQEAFEKTSQNTPESYLTHASNYQRINKIVLISPQFRAEVDIERIKQILESLVQNGVIVEVYLCENCLDSAWVEQFVRYGILYVVKESFLQNRLRCDLGR